MDADGQSGAENRGQAWLDAAFWAWGVFIVAVSVKTFVEPAKHTVYPVFAQAARHWWHDEPVYADYGRSLGLDLFRYSPTFAVAMTPLAALPDRLGGLLWNLLSIGVLLAALQRMLADVLPGSWSRRQMGLFWGLTLVGAARGIWSAQSNTLLISCVLLAASAIARRRFWQAALLLAAAVSIKIWPLALVMLLVPWWPWALGSRFLAAGATLAAVPFLTRPWPYVLDQYRGWAAMLIDTRTLRWPGYRDAWTIWEATGAPPHLDAYLGLQLIGGLAVLAWCLVQGRRNRDVRHRLTSILAAWVTWQMLFGPGTERLTYMILAPVTAWAVVASLARRRGRTLALAAWLMTGPFGMGGLERALEPYSAAATAILPLGALVFAVWLVHNGADRSGASENQRG
jgi:hypothetical protein